MYQDSREGIHHEKILSNYLIGHPSSISPFYKNITLTLTLETQYVNFAKLLIYLNNILL